jgi:hypothetical protein
MVKIEGIRWNELGVDLGRPSLLLLSSLLVSAMRLGLKVMK